VSGSPSEEARRALGAALRYLARGDRTQHEVVCYLHRKGFSDQAAQEAIQRLDGWGYLEDRRVALHWARAKMQRSLWGPLRVAMGLQRRGIDPDTVQEVLSGLSEETPEWDLALAAAKKYLRTHPGAGPALSRRLGAHLARRGFEPAMIRRILRQELKEKTCEEGP
jgi:regulatory protein